MKGSVQTLLAELDDLCRAYVRNILIMEVCGTHTVSIFRSGIRSMLPANLRLVSGPGCPVCVTAQRHIDAVIELARVPDAIIATYGDMLRVPGKLGSLEKLRATGAQVRVVNSASTALAIAEENPDHPVIFLAVGFETTAPATAATILQAESKGIDNFFVLPTHKLVVPAMTALLAAGDVPLDGFLCPGHVSVIIGADAYLPVVTDYGKACVVAGFEPVQIMQGLVHVVRQVVTGRATLENVYEVAVTPEGNTVAMDLMHRVFTPGDTPWRALGVIPDSGLDLRDQYRSFDALRRFDVVLGEDEDHPQCLCGQVIQGKAAPDECPLFGTVCTPIAPVGPCMVSSEGTCAAWYKYNRPGCNVEGTVR